MKIKAAQRVYLKDPRFSHKQKVALDGCLRHDPNAEILGIDANRRPVVLCDVGIPRVKRAWAILKDGEPADVRWEDKEGPHDDPLNLAEPWVEPRKKKGKRWDEAEQRHYDQHSRTQPMESCNQPECMKATAAYKKSQKEEA